MRTHRALYVQFPIMSGCWRSKQSLINCIILCLCPFLADLFPLRLLSDFFGPNSWGEMKGSKASSPQKSQVVILWFVSELMEALETNADSERKRAERLNRPFNSPENKASWGNVEIKNTFLVSSCHSVIDACFIITSNEQAADKKLINNIVRICKPVWYLNLKSTSKDTCNEIYFCNATFSRCSMWINN